MSPTITSHTYTGQWKRKYRVTCCSHGFLKRKSWIKVLKLLSQCTTHRFVTQSPLKWEILKEKTHTPAFALWPLRDSAPSSLCQEFPTLWMNTKHLRACNDGRTVASPQGPALFFVKICYQGPYTRCRVLDVTKGTCLSLSVNRPDTNRGVDVWCPTREHCRTRT